MYEGTFCENKYHGYGRFIDVYSFCYVGQFENGLRQGKGAGTDNLGIVRDGQWIRNIYQRPGDIKKPEEGAA